MKTMQRLGLFVLVPAAIWLFAGFVDVQAQGKKQKKDGHGKGRDKNEQMAEKEKGGKAKYKPHGMTDEDMKDWTDGNPPGWSRGNKTGWGGAGVPPGKMKAGDQELLHGYPPGSENWDTGRKEEWRGELERSRSRILEQMRSGKRMSQEEEESAIISIERAAQEGVPIKPIEKTMNRAINRGMAGRDIEKVTRAMSYGVDKDTDYNKLDRFIEKKMNEGETGDDLALSIYKEIDERHAEKQEEPAKKSWWKRFFGG
ncbi:MAG TPA: hypothetical protein ENO11_05425 [Desulfobacteraceae bacterium]|nr:hypothetical protein [Desulfobacteraceae bacterium]